MNNTPAHNPHLYIRSRCPKLTLAFWTFALILWIYALLTGTTPAHAASTTAALPDLYYIVVDRSGSMGPSENNLVGPATDKLREFVSNLPASTSVRIVFFNTTMGQTGCWSDLTSQAKKEISRWITTEFRPTGGTRLFDTVAQVLNDAIKEKDQYSRIGLLVFSDGEDNASERYKSWSEIERISSQLVAEHPAAFMRLYSLGREIRTTPGAPWKTEAAPEAADLQKITLEPSPEARFKIIPESAEIGQNVVFVVLPGPGRIESASWKFSDGSSASGTAVEHIFTNAGVSNGSLTVTGSSGTDTKPFSVTVADRVPLRAAFAWLPKTARIGDTIEFVDESTGNPSEAKWFIDSKPVGSGRMFSWKSDRSGSFSVRVEIKRGDEIAEATRNIRVLRPKLNAGFAVSSGYSVSLGTPIIAKATAQEADISHEWYAAELKIGDHADLAWIPSQAGLLEVRHRVVRDDEEAEAIDRIQVVTQPPPAEFTISPSLEIDLGQTITVKATKSEPTWRHSWRISSGETFAEPSITWQPNHLGRLEIIHIVESPTGRGESRETLLVHDKVSAAFTVSSIEGQIPLEVKFAPHSETGVVSFLWDFGDGETSSAGKPSHTYQAVGEYHPRLTLRDVAGREFAGQFSMPIMAKASHPKWIAWATRVGGCLALLLVGILFTWDRQRLVDLDGRLEWRFGINRGRVDLSGRQLDLSSLNIPGWKPTSAYTLVRRKAPGYLLLRDGVLEQGVDEDSSLEADGVRLRLVP